MKLSPMQKRAVVEAAHEPDAQLVRVGAGYGVVWRTRDPSRWCGKLVKQVVKDVDAWELLGDLQYVVWWTGSVHVERTRRAVLHSLLTDS